MTQVYNFSAGPAVCCHSTRRTCWASLASLPLRWSAEKWLITRERRLTLLPM